MSDTDWRQVLRDDLDRLEQSHLLRRRRIVRPIDATHVEIDGRRYVNFSSNDYLGLTRHPRVLEAAGRALLRDGAGSGAAPLICGHGPAHASAEAALARWKGTEAAVLFSSGYQANTAAVQTLASLDGAPVGPALPASSSQRAVDPASQSNAQPAHPAPRAASSSRTGASVQFLIDRLCHASLVDAVRQSGRAYHVYPHNDIDALGRLISETKPDAITVVVTESIFSMDGDAVDLRGIVELKSRRGFILLLDEAHASGVYGPAGAGYAAECGLQQHVDVTVVTLSKALGCVGGGVCASQLVCDALVNRARPFIYSTGLPPAIASAAEAAIEVMREEPDRQQRVRDLARRVRAELARGGISLPPGDSPIIPIVLGSEQAAMQAAANLELAGFLALPIRPPTVPKGTSRLRLNLSCEHKDEEVSGLLDAIR